MARTRFIKKKKQRHEMNRDERLKDDIIKIVTTTVLHMFTLLFFVGSIISTFLDWFGNNSKGLSMWSIELQTNKDFMSLVLTMIGIAACTLVVYLALTDLAEKGTNIIVSFVAMIIALLNLALGTLIILELNEDNVEVKIGAYIFILLNAFIVYINSAVLLINKHEVEEIAEETVEELEEVVELERKRK